ncbi:MAG TPA: lysine-2,3-aminomutase-like protein [Stellaceae bacterium]|nr:lysine-2,3-aminomutase-like protein [Stellaceae bacterium]
MALERAAIPRRGRGLEGARATLRSPSALLDAGVIEADRLPALERVAAEFAVAVTPGLAELIDPADPADPIARQFVPDERELEISAEEQADPIGDEAFSPLKGIVHRYPDRVLLKPAHVCPVYCRFCFRREVVGPGGDALDAAELDAAIGYIRDHAEIWEVILTGGDPLMLAPRRLAAIVEALSAIEHVAVIRLHSRVPVVDPARITAELLAALDTEKALYVVLHSNHAREMTPAAAAACRSIVRAGIPMLGQTVLLKGVNDDAAVLTELFRMLVAHRIKPYYLHHADLARGTGHFRTSIEAGQALMRALRGRVSGLCQPTYVLDIPGGHGKVPIGPDYLAEAGMVEDYRGGTHAYPPKAET